MKHDSATPFQMRFEPNPNIEVACPGCGLRVSRWNEERLRQAEIEALLREKREVHESEGNAEGVEACNRGLAHYGHKDNEQG
jgi:hypothetical protein